MSRLQHPWIGLRLDKGYVNASLVAMPCKRLWLEGYAVQPHPSMDRTARCHGSCGVALSWTPLSLHALEQDSVRRREM
jgi:hypothetical protein